MNILLVEDHPLVARTTLRMLRDRGHTLTHVASVSAAERYLVATPHCFDVVILDHGIEGGNGWSLRARCGAARVILTGGDGPPADARYYFLKGTPPQLLFDLIEQPKKED